MNICPFVCVVATFLVGVQTASGEAPSRAEDQDAAPKTDTDAALDPRYPTKQYIDAVNARAGNPSLGYGFGRLGDGFVTSIRGDVPLNDWLYLRFLSTVNHGPFRRPYDPVWSNGMHIMIRSPVYMGAFRLYGGGGFFVGWRPNPVCGTFEGLAPGDIEEIAQSNPARMLLCDEQKDAVTLSGGGYSGIEFFGGPKRGYFIEVGGGGGAQKSGIWDDSGLILMAGNHFYF